MRNILLPLGLSLLISTSIAANAADTVFVDDAPEPVGLASPSYDWSGAYIGVHGGYAWADAEGVLDQGGSPGGPYDLTEFNLDGGIVGAHAGYNFQFGQFVLGAEADISVGLASDTLDGVPGLPGDLVNVSGELDVLASVRARAGFAINNILLYGTVGAGYAEYKTSGQFPRIFEDASVTDDDWGVVYGGGVEYGFGKWVGRLEALHYDVSPSRVFDGGEIPDADFGDNVDYSGVTTVRVGLSLKF